MDAELYFDDVAIFRTIVGPIANNVFIVQCLQTGDSILIDAANEHNKLLELSQRLGVKRVVETHGHWDHIGAVEAVREAGIDVSVSMQDAHRLPSYDQIIDDEQLIPFGRQNLRVLFTPGHTEGSLCFELVGHPIVFSGDTLFPGGPGATTFEGGDFHTIIESIESRLFREFPKDTVILPGHGSYTSLGAESPHLEEWIERGW